MLLTSGNSPGARPANSNTLIPVKGGGLVMLGNEAVIFKIGQYDVIFNYDGNQYVVC